MICKHRKYGKYCCNGIIYKQCLHCGHIELIQGNDESIYAKDN